MQTVKDDFVKNHADVKTSQQLQQLIEANLNNAEMFNDATPLTKMTADQKDLAGKVFDAFSGGMKLD
jgi:hypothetical protein